MRPCRFGKQLAEHAIGRFGGRRHNKDVTLPAELNRRVDHEVVAGMARNRNGVSGSLGGGIDRAHVRPHQTRARLRFMDRRDAEIAKGLHDQAVDTVHVSNNCWFHKSMTLLCASNRLTLQRYVRFDEDLVTAIKICHIITSAAWAIQRFRLLSNV